MACTDDPASASGFVFTHRSRLLCRIPHLLKTSSRFGIDLSFGLAEGWIHGARPSALLALDAVGGVCARVRVGSDHTDEARATRGE